MPITVPSNPMKGALFAQCAEERESSLEAHALQRGRAGHRLLRGLRTASELTQARCDDGRFPRTWTR